MFQPNNLYGYHYNNFVQNPTLLLHNAHEKTIKIAHMYIAKILCTGLVSRLWNLHIWWAIPHLVRFIQKIEKTLFSIFLYIFFALNPGVPAPNEPPITIFLTLTMGRILWMTFPTMQNLTRKLRDQILDIQSAQTTNYLSLGLVLIVLPELHIVHDKMLEPYN